MKIEGITVPVSKDAARAAVLDIQTLVYFMRSFAIDQDKDLDKRFCNQKFVKVVSGNPGEKMFSVVDEGEPIKQALIKNIPFDENNIDTSSYITYVLSKITKKKITYNTYSSDGNFTLSFAFKNCRELAHATSVTYELDYQKKPRLGSLEVPSLVQPLKKMTYTYIKMYVDNAISLDRYEEEQVLANDSDLPSYDDATLSSDKSGEQNNYQRTNTNENGSGSGSSSSCYRSEPPAWEDGSKVGAGLEGRKEDKVNNFENGNYNNSYQSAFNN
eukprot:Awhi_evm1s1965